MAIYTCKYCGDQRYANSFGDGLCNCSPTKKHEILSTTEKKDKYICKYCGKEYPHPFAGACRKSPHGNHELLG